MTDAPRPASPAQTDERLQDSVESPDGTAIAYWHSGTGRPLVMVHGTSADHTRWAPLLPLLEPNATVYTMDRRGRGQSGDAPEYDLEREYEDVAAVVDAVAKIDGPVDVYGHSYGALCSLGAATLTDNIRRLVLYEPPLDVAFPMPPEAAKRLDELMATGDREAVLETFFREVVGGSDAELEALRKQPSWKARVAAAHTITREARAEHRGFDMARAARIQVPTLLLVGADNPERIKASSQSLASTLGDARVVQLEGQKHLADVLAPREFARPVLDFLKGRS